MRRSSQSSSTKLSVKAREFPGKKISMTNLMFAKIITLKLATITSD
jgi:hypothetical protein